MKYTIRETTSVNRNFPQSIIDRINWKSPIPIISHQFGLRTLESTRKGVEEIANSQVLDVVCLDIDPEALESFFVPKQKDLDVSNEEGIPVLSVEDYRSLHAASRCGNYPLMRIASGTNDFIHFDEMYIQPFKNAWCTISLLGSNQMDGRGKLGLEASIREHQRSMSFYGKLGIPMEFNESHFWAKCDAPDIVCVVVDYLSAINARAFGVKDFIIHLAFGDNPGMSDEMDLAKMLATLDLINPLNSPEFRIWRETSTKKVKQPLDSEVDVALMRTSIDLQLFLKPHIMHLFDQADAHHPLTTEKVIDTSNKVLELLKKPDRRDKNLIADRAVQARRAELVSEARILLQAIRNLSMLHREKPLGELKLFSRITDPDTLARAVTSGVLDAPQLLSNPFGRGQIKTNIINGACQAVGLDGEPIAEGFRLSNLNVCF